MALQFSSDVGAVGSFRPEQKPGDAVLGAALNTAWGVLRTSCAWPDLLQAVAIAVLALSQGISVIRQALSEARQRRVDMPLVQYSPNHF